MGSRGDRRQDISEFNAPPGLQFLCEAEATLSEPLEMGATPRGNRCVVAIEPGGWVEGPQMKGRYLSGSTITYLIRADGIVEFRGCSLLGMDDGPIISLNTKGIRRLPPEAMEALAQGQPYDPATVHARAFASFEAAEDGPYAWMNRSLFISRSFRTVDIFRVGFWEIL